MIVKIWSYDMMEMTAPRGFRWSALLLSALILAGCQDADVKVSTRDSAGTSSGDTVEARGDWIDSADTTGTPPRAGRDSVATTSRNITVAAPGPDDRIDGSAFTLRGTARTFENSVAYRVTGGDGVVLAEGHTTATGEMGTFSPYSVRVELKPGYNGDALLEVFQFSAKDGSEIDKVSIPIRVISSAETGMMILKTYFTSGPRGTAADCRTVFPRNRRVPQTVAVAEAALNALLEGPTDAERREGYGTEIPDGTRLRSITIENGRATADFNAALNRAAGSCAVSSARAQIERTLRQFPTVTSVVISVEGNSATALQP